MWKQTDLVLSDFRLTPNRKYESSFSLIKSEIGRISYKEIFQAAGDFFAETDFLKYTILLGSFLPVSSTYGAVTNERVHVYLYVNNLPIYVYCRLTVTLPSTKSLLSRPSIDQVANAVYEVAL